MSHRKKYLLIGGFFLIAGISITFLFFEWKEKEKHLGFESCEKQYTYISSEIDCGTIDGRIDQFKSISQDIQAYIDQEKLSHHIDETAVFFRDLSARRWFGINENTNFYPASLAKLPFAMMLYKTAEVDKAILDEPITIDDADTLLNTGQHYAPEITLKSGQSYPLHETVRDMLVSSDNTPINKLMAFSSPFRDPILEDLGILVFQEESTDAPQWNITAKSYANLFRILYNVSYLRPEYSNTLLEQLALSTFKNGLVAGVPNDVKVAHKFGEASEKNEATGEIYTILNDCGIIYKQDSPYILCVMTQGQDFSRLEKNIETISRKIYDAL